MKLIAFALAALFALTACPDDKKADNAPSGAKADAPEKKHGW